MSSNLIQNLRVKISQFNRKRKFNTFMEKLQPSSETTILDVGFASKESAESYNYLEKNYPYLHNITALGLDDPKHFLEKYPQVKALQYDGGKFPFADKTFDVCWSNAVLEHVGNHEKQKMFLAEIKRVSKVAFITTPNKYFPIEIHTNIFLLHFLLPKNLFQKYLVWSGRKWAVGDWMNLLSLKDIQNLLAENGINHYQVIKNKFLGFTLDFVIIWQDC